MARGYRRAVYQIGITADITEFQKALNQALNSLKQLGEKPVLIGELQQASAAALDLATNLRTAVNQNTGKLDLTTFSKNLQQSGKTLEQYRDMLISLGPSGTEAFLQVAQAITKAEMPLIRSNKLLSDLWITMKNTVRWQFTNSALHGFIGSLQTAYGYSKSLDSSLNSIRIVTQQSTEDMAKFAEQANEAAKTLSTTTVDYTDASLIYYQQGLNTEEVQGRTETTIKMANAANESAEIVSQQLTAVWNNFYDGSKSLEYYADVMVALGASTASSSDEIAEGIQKFASVANTVGLSYEYGASALATLTANTRESADVVGNSLKTLFSRIQGLQLGDTLDDGTDLNKYSKALQAVGVSIKDDITGNLKDMDDILDETAAKWNTLSRDQQMALAQTVAGVRQYTQFIALMENWGDFQENLNTALTSSGALQEQADIYAKSWEAARKRVKAAAEDIYDSLINPDFYIDADNFLTPLLSGTAEVIDAMGGMKGILNTLGVLITSVYGDKIAQSMREMAVTLGFMTGEEQKRATALQQNAAQLARATIYETTEVESIRMKIDAQKAFIDLQGQAAEHMAKLNPLQQENLRMDLEHVQNLYKQVDAYSEASSKAQEFAEKYRNDIADIIGKNEGLLAKIKEVGKEVNNITPKLQGNKDIKINVDTKSARVAINSLLDTLEKLVYKQKGIEIIRAQLTTMGGIAKGITPEIVKLAQEFGLLGEKVDINSGRTNKFFESIQKGTGDTEKLRSGIKLITTALEDLGAKKNDISKFTANYKEYQSNLEATKVATDSLGDSIDNIRNKFYTLQYQQISVSEAIVATSNQLMRLGMMIQSIKTLGNVWNDEDISLGDKFIQTLTSLGMIIPTVVSVIELLNKSKMTYTMRTIQSTEATAAETIASGLSTRQKIVETRVVGENTVAVIANTTAWYANPVFWIAAAIIGVVAAFSAYNTAVKENTEKIRENAKEAAEQSQAQADSAKAEREEVQSLYKEYIELRAKLDNSSEAKEALREHTEKLCEALGVEWSTLDKLQNKYEEVNKQIAIANRDALLDDIKKTKEALTSTKVSMTADGADFDDYYETAKYGIKFDAGAIGSDEQEISDAFYEALKNAGIDESFIAKSGTASADFSFRVTGAEEFISAYAAIDEAITALNQDPNLESARIDSEIFQAAKDWIAEYATEYDKIVGYQQDLLDYADQLAEAEAAIAGVDLANVDTLEQYQEIKEQYINQLKETFTELDLITPEMDDEYFDNLAEQYLSGYSHLADKILADNALEEILEKVGTENEETVRKFLEDDRYKLNILAALNWEVLANEDDLESAIETAYNDIKDKIEAQEFKAVIPVVISTMDKLAEGKDLTDEEIAQLEALEAEYSQLASIRDKTSAQYIQALRDIREGMEATVSRDALRSLNDAWDELRGIARGAIDELDGTVRDAKASYKVLKDTFGENIDLVIDLDSEEAMQQLEAIMDADYAVQLAIEADLQTDIDDVLDYASKIQEATGLIQEGFKIAYDDAQILQSVFPGILSGYTITADGMIQLDREIAEQHLNLATTQIEADKEACRQNILDYQKVLLSKAAAMRTIAEGLQALATTDKNESEKVAEAKAKIENGITQLKDACAQEQALISENLSESEVNDSNQVLGANDNAATTSANNWAGAYESMTQNSGKWARIAIQNANAVAQAMRGAAEGQVITPEATMGGIFNRFSGGFEEAAYSGTYESAGVEEKSWEDYYESGDYQSAYEEAIKQAEAYEAAASNLDVFLAQLDGAVGTAKNLVDTAGTNKDKSGKEKDNTGKILDPEDKKDLEDIEERYHEITREIKRQSDLLDDINNATERAYGVNKIRSYKKEQEALNKQLENQKKKLAEAEWYLQGRDDGVLSDRDAVLAAFPTANIDAQTGEILNYTSLLRENFDTYNAFIDSYNEWRASYSLMTKDQQEALESELNEWEQKKDLADKIYEKNTHVLKQYEDTLDTIQETRDNIEQLQRDIDDNRLNQIEYRLEIVLEIKNMKDLVSKLTKEIAESFGDAITHGLNVAAISADDARREAALYPEYQQQYNDLVREYETADDQADRDRIIHDIEELQSKVVASGEALLEWIETIDDLLPDAIDDARTRFEHFTNWLDHNTTVLDTIKELYALQGVTYKTQQGFDRLQKTSAEKMEALTNKAALNRSWYEHASTEVEAARAMLESLNGNEQDVRWDVYKANYDALLKEQQAAQESMLESAKEAMEVAREMATLSLEKTMYDLDQQLSKGLGLDLLQDKYDHYIEKEERYLDKVNEAYQVASWYDKLQADIDKTSDKAMRDRLKALQEEIDTRREGNKLSQYDLDILEAKYKVLQAQMALEDAQNAKNNYNLVRDRQGNWNYQFTADPDEVANAEQNLIDAENEWYNIAKQQVKDVTGEIIATMTECKEKVQEIWQQMIDGTLTEEEGYARIAELREYYTEKIKYLEEEKNVAIADMNEAGNKALLDMAILYGDKVSDLTGLTAEDVKRIIEESGASIKDLLLADNETIKDIVGSNTDLIDLFDNVFAKDLANMTDTAKDFEKNLDDALSKCENNWDDYGNKIENIADKTGTSLDKLDEQVEDVAESNEWLYETGMQVVDALWEQLEATRMAAEGYAELAQEIMGVIEQLRELAQAQVEYVETKADLGNSDWAADKYIVDDYSREMLNVFDKYGGGQAGADALFGKSFEWLWSDRDTKYEVQGWADKGAKTNSYLESLFQAAARGEKWALDELDRVRKQGQYFDTGGYTGEFNDAKLAFLHEKELVLNQDDTKNILTAVSAIRTIGPELFASIEKMIDGNAVAAMSLLGDRVPSSNGVDIPSTTIEQKVTIEHVEFPDVTSAGEIIQAFEGLTNDAAQWAQRRTD